MLCCLHGWRRLVCGLDNLNHAVLRRFAIRSLCDLHDRYLMQPSMDTRHGSNWG